jgi:AraC-like DNA-binding protein
MKEDIINFPQINAPETPFHLQMTGISYCDGSYHIRRKNTSTYVFEYVIKGRGTLSVNGQTSEPEAGDIYIVPAFSEHEYYSSAKDPWEKIWFNTEGSLVENLISAYKLKGVHLVKDLNLHKLFLRGYETAKEFPESANESVSLIIHEIIMKIAAKIKGDKETPHSPEGMKLKNYLDLHFNDELNLKTMAKLINKSPSQTIRIFKKEYGSSPYQYHLERKIDSAKMLLCNSAISVKETAFRLGFKDEYYFSNIFKKKTGLAPGLYRKKH